MPWSLGGVFLSPDDEEYEFEITAQYAVQTVIGAQSSDVQWYGTPSERRRLDGILFENSNSNVGLSSLDNYATSGSTVPLITDQGADGSYKIASLRARRKQALNYTQPVWRVSLELIQV